MLSTARIVRPIAPIINLKALKRQIHGSAGRAEQVNKAAAVSKTHTGRVQSSMICGKDYVKEHGRMQTRVPAIFILTCGDFGSGI